MDANGLPRNDFSVYIYFSTPLFRLPQIAGNPGPVPAVRPNAVGIQDAMPSKDASGVLDPIRLIGEESRICTHALAVG